MSCPAPVPLMRSPQISAVLSTILTLTESKPSQDLRIDRSVNMKTSMFLVALLSAACAVSFVSADPTDAIPGIIDISECQICRC